jgi:hypothetical protein
MGDEDKRAAVGIQVSLSNSLITAALAVLGAQAAIVTFVLDRRVGLTLFYVWAGTGTLCLIGSMLFGGKGIASAYKSGFSGTWSEKSKVQFQSQTWLALIGVVAVGISVFCGDLKPEPSNPEIVGLSRRIETLETQLRDSSAASMRDRERLATIEQTFRSEQRRETSPQVSQRPK